jgi:hypothetical protein
VGSAFSPELERAIRQEQTRFHVSRSFVIATACAHALGVEEQPDYRPTSPRVARPTLLADQLERFVSRAHTAQRAVDALGAGRRRP